MKTKRGINSKKSYSTKKTMTKFSHRWLASDSKKFGQNLICHHCKGNNESKIDHDHFLTCDQSTSRKDERIQELLTLLNRL